MAAKFRKLTILNNYACEQIKAMSKENRLRQFENLLGRLVIAKGMIPAYEPFMGDPVLYKRDRSLITVDRSQKTQLNN